MMTSEVIRFQPMTNFRIARDRTGTTTGDIAQYEIELIAEFTLCCIGHLATYVGFLWKRAQQALHLLQSPHAHITGHDFRRWVFLRENRKLSAGRSAAIQYSISLPCQL